MMDDYFESGKRILVLFSVNSQVPIDNNHSIKVLKKLTQMENIECLLSESDVKEVGIFRFQKRFLSMEQISKLIAFLEKNNEKQFMEIALCHIYFKDDQSSDRLINLLWDNNRRLFMAQINMMAKIFRNKNYFGIIKVIEKKTDFASYDNDLLWHQKDLKTQIVY